MPDSLTLSVMKQIARKAGGNEAKFEAPQEYIENTSPHLTDAQTVLLSELIHREKRGCSPASTITAPSRKEGAMSLDQLVKSTKNR